MKSSEARGGHGMCRQTIIVVVGEEGKRKERPK